MLEYAVFFKPVDKWSVRLTDSKVMKMLRCNRDFAIF